MIKHDIALFRLWQTYLALNLALAKCGLNKDLGGGLEKVDNPKAGGVS